MASQASFNDPKKPCVAKGQDTKEEETFKDKLDRVATEARQVAHSKNEKPNPIVETVKQCVPGVAKILSGRDEAGGTTAAAPPEGPPERPHHDVHIEEFVRDQHRSKRDDGLLEG